MRSRTSATKSAEIKTLRHAADVLETCSSLQGHSPQSHSSLDDSSVDAGTVSQPGSFASSPQYQSTPFAHTQFHSEQESLTRSSSNQGLEFGSETRESLPETRGQLQHTGPTVPLPGLRGLWQPSTGSTVSLPCDAPNVPYKYNEVGNRTYVELRTARGAIPPIGADADQERSANLAGYFGNANRNPDCHRSL